MAPEIGTKNVVFRSIEDKWRGPLPCSSAELSFGVLLAMPMALWTNALIAGVSGLGLVALLVMWRRLDHDRSDYLQAFLRRRLAPKGQYNANIDDGGHTPLRPR
jgi:hypothetical protein